MSDVQHFSGKVTPIPASTGGCGVVIKPGVEPSTPEIGGFWFDDALNAFAYFEKGGSGIYFPNTNGNVDEVLVSNGNTVPTYKPHGRLLHGVVPPVDLTDGANGDFFLDTATSTLYGPKASGTWPAGVSIIGATGPAGAVGPTGTGFLFAEGHYNNGVVNNVGAAVNIADTFNTPDTGVMNVLGRHLTVKGSGSFTTAGGETPTFTLACNFGGVEFITFTTGNLTAGVTGKFDFEFVLATTTIGAAGAGIGRGVLNIQLAGPGAYTTYRNSDVDAAGINLTAAAGITLRAASSANIGTVAIDETTGQIF